MARLITAQRPFKLLVANLQGSGDPSRGNNPVKVRTGFEQQHFPEVSRGSTPTRVSDPSSPGEHTHQGLQAYTTPLTPVGATATLVVASNVFTLPATLYLGPYVIVSGQDFTTGGTTDLTATALAAAIDALPGFAAAAVASTITITGPFGPGGNDTRIEAIYGGTVRNYTITSANGFMFGAEPTIGPPDIL